MLNGCLGDSAIADYIPIRTSEVPLRRQESLYVDPFDDDTSSTVSDLTSDSSDIQDNITIAYPVLDLSDLFAHTQELPSVYPTVTFTEIIVPPVDIPTYIEQELSDNLSDYSCVENTAVCCMVANYLCCPSPCRSESALEFDRQLGDVATDPFRTGV